MKIDIDSNQINIKIIRKKIKNIYFRFNSNLELIVSCNKYVTDYQIMDMIKDNEQKIIKMYYEIIRREKNKDNFAILGERLNIIIDSSVKKVFIDGRNIYAPEEEAIDKYYLKESKKFLAVRYERVFQMMGDLPECKLRFRKMKTRWGVCNSTEKIITLNTELYKYDVSLIDYVIIHELCHLKEANHSSEFWNEVSKYYPHYKQARKLLKEGV